MLKSYLKKIFRTANQGDAREESYYAALEDLMEDLAQSFGKSKIHITRNSIFTSKLGSGRSDLQIM